MDGYDRFQIVKRLTDHHVCKNTCMLWTGTVGNHGYGVTHILGKIRMVHRISYALFFDEPDLDFKFNVKQTCGNKLCISPDHLRKKVKTKIVKVIKD